MATVKWRGDAAAIAQVDKFTPASVTVGNIFTITINGKTVSFTATAATVANVTAGLTAACNASTIPEFAELSWADVTTYLTATADTVGKPFTATSSAAQGSGSAGMSLTRAAVTANSSPNDVNNAANWSGGALPANSDDVIIEATSSSLLWNLSSLSGVTLATLTIRQSFTGDIGLSEVNADGSSEYFEYRPTYLAIGATLCTIGEGPGAGSGRIKLNYGSVQNTTNVYGSGPAAEDGLESVLLKGTHASNALNVNKGSVGVAVLSGETATFATARIGYTDNLAGDSTARFGSGTTLTTVQVSGGVVQTNSAITTLTMTGGQLTHAAGAITTANLDGGTLNYLSSGTITLAEVGSDAKLDFSRDMRPRTVTTVRLYPGCTLIDSFRTCTFTNGVNLTRGSIADYPGLDLGTHINLVIAAAA